MKTYKDDRLFSLLRSNLDDVANMYESIVASGTCTNNTSNSCLGLMRQYLSAQNVTIGHKSNMAWIHRPVESRFFSAMGWASQTLSANNITSWRDARNLTRRVIRPCSNSSDCEAIQHLQCNSTMCRLFFEGEGEMPRQYDAPGMIGIGR